MYSGSDINSYQDLVLCNLRLKLRSNKLKNIKRLHFNVNRLIDPKIVKLYSSKLDENFNNLDINDCDSTDIYTKCENIIISTASEIIEKDRSKKQHYITDDILDSCDEIRLLKSKKKQQPELDSIYRQINATIRKSMQTAIDNWIQMHTHQSMMILHIEDIIN